LEIFENEQKELENVLGKMSQEDTESKMDTATSPESKVSLATLEKTISEVSGVPIVRISSDIYTQIKDLEGVLKTKIFGQEEAINQVCKTLKRSYTGVSPHSGPIGSFLLLGPTGVGKTELVKVLTEELYGDISKYLLKIDMSEFRERHSMSRLLGAPAGYVGYEDAPQLTSFLKKKPYSVILFDEIEKGHPEMLNILLQMLDEGKVTDAKGETVTCEHALVFMTSNLGRNQLNKFASKIGFVDIGDQEEEDYQAIKKQVMDEVEKAVRPEILGRINGKIVFRPIGKTVLAQVIQKEIQIVQKHMLSRGISLVFDPKVIDYIVNKAKDKIEYGAREVKAMVAEQLLDPISEYLLENPDNRSLEIKIKKDTLSIKKSR
jgi:ATP-dependent Clp protease ATP-binding subunit ClpC